MEIENIKKNNAAKKPKPKKKKKKLKSPSMPIIVGSKKKGVLSNLRDFDFEEIQQLKRANEQKKK